MASSSTEIPRKWGYAGKPVAPVIPKDSGPRWIWERAGSPGGYKWCVGDIPEWMTKANMEAKAQADFPPDTVYEVWLPDGRGTAESGAKVAIFTFQDKEIARAAMEAARTKWRFSVPDYIDSGFSRDARPYWFAELDGNAQGRGNSRPRSRRPAARGDDRAGGGGCGGGEAGP